jgi:secreted trypsin-like serine protease
MAIGKLLRPLVIAATLSLSLLLTLLTLFTFTPPTQAVTFGSNVDAPGDDAPWVVSIWVSSSGDSDDVSYACTGTLISNEVVLTAAHCLFEKGSYFVKFGATTLEEDVELIPASNTWLHPRYNPTKFANDIGLIKLNESVSLDNFPLVGGQSVGRAINVRSKFTLFGWGRNQNDKSPELLGTTRLLNLDRMAEKTYGSAFNSNIMLGAGLYITREKVWAGACSGDSGGPLLMKLSGKTYIVGVTSWGARNCDTSKPSVFARVNYYESDIQKGIKDLSAVTKVVNRAVPINVKKPTITGDVVPGGVLKCNPGSWKNSLNVRIIWSAPSRLLNSTNETVQILNSDSGESFSCDVLATGKTGSVRRTVSVDIPDEPQLVGAMAISGISPEKPFIGGEQLKCEGFTWGGTFDSTSQEWHIVKDPKNNKVSEATLVGKEGVLAITSEFLEKNQGSHLVCITNAVNKGFTVSKSISRIIEKGATPEISNLRIAIEKNLNGAIATCLFDGKKDGMEVSYRWTYGTGEEVADGRSSVLRISEEIAEKSQRIDLGCTATLTNSLGESKKSVKADQGEISKLFSPVYQVRSTANWAIGSQVLCEKTFGLSQANSEIMWGTMASPTATSFIRPLGMGQVLLFNENIAHQSAGELIGCSVLVSDKGALSRKYFATEVPASAAPDLATLSAPTVAVQDPSNKTVKVTLQIPTVSNFNRNVMELKLVMPGTSCDQKIIDATPNQMLCTGLSGDTSYSASLKLSYINPKVTKSSTSPVTTFKTEPLIPLTLAPTRVSAEQQEGGAIAYIGDQVDCPVDKSVKKLTESDLSRTSYTFCWPEAAWTAWQKGGRDWTNFLNLKKFTAPVPPAPILVEQIMVTDFSGSINLKFSIPQIPGFDASTMGLMLNTSGGSGSGVEPGMTVTLQYFGPEMDYTAHITLWSKTVGGVEIKGPSLLIRTIKNTWVLTDIDPPTVSAWVPFSADDYRGVMPASGPTGTGVGVRYKITDDVEITSGSIRFVNAAGAVIAQGASALIGGSNRDAHYFAKITIPQGSANMGDVITIQGNATDKSGKVSPWVNVGTFTIAADIPDYPTINITNISAPVTPLATSGSGGQGRVGSTITINYNTYASRGADVNHGVKLVAGSVEIPVTPTVRQTAGALRATWQDTFVIPANVVVGTTYSVQVQITDYYNYKSVWTEIGTLTILPPYTP